MNTSKMSAEELAQNIADSCLVVDDNGRFCGFMSEHAERLIGIYTAQLGGSNSIWHKMENAPQDCLVRIVVPEWNNAETVGAWTPNGWRAVDLVTVVKSDQFKAPFVKPSHWRHLADTVNVAQVQQAAMPVDGRLEALQKAVDGIAAYFVSGNSVPVERATLTTKHVEA